MNSSRAFLWISLWTGLLLLTACATSTIESRRQERAAAYNALSPQHRQLVDQGQIKVGMSADAVYIAWGPPSEQLESEDERGHWTTWVYTGQVMEESRYWTYREIARDGTTFLERRLESDYFPRSYVRAEIYFQDGIVKSWRTLPKPAASLTNRQLASSGSATRKWLGSAPARECALGQ